ncbi:hypothetical protein ES677_03365 [Bizionia gelidisalsuginis]|uniref:Tetratricopeptide repeat protein n=2 Tax=Bizionia gelidisalsuginis TaxID=291188 RepID=A0ABY3MCZ2_9FLAO|nr:hypothetical protein ES677_03365 [Bizionia gelidisalsuginis]
MYHLIKNRNQYYWIFLILFIPAIGSAIYLITQVYNKRDGERIQEGITAVLTPSKKVKDLEKKLEFSETYLNRINLAEAYFEMKDFENAITHYKIALEDKGQNNLFVIKKLIAGYYQTNNFERSVFYGDQIKDVLDFRAKNAQFLYGLALNELGRVEEAEEQLRQIDQRYSNYNERLALAKFLQNKGKMEDAQEILKELKTESEHFTKPNKIKYKPTMHEVEMLLAKA